MYLFDFDGTLVDSNGVWVEIDNGFLARRGLTPTREYSDTVGHSIFPIAAQFTKDYYCLDMTPEAIMAEWLDMARDAYARQVPMKPGAEAFLARHSSGTQAVRRAMGSPAAAHRARNASAPGFMGTWRA